MNNFIKSIAVLSVAILATACKGDYLDTEPTDKTGETIVFKNTANAAMAINGICKMMTTQYLESQGFNGEGTIKMYYGNYPGNNFFVNLSGWAVLINGTYNDNTSSTYCYYPWFYYYKLIGNANNIIAQIDNVDGVQEKKDFIKAQALTFRAYSYMMLAQLYANRWGDSNNGASDGLVLRVDKSDGDLAVSTLKQTYEQIYTDLDQAITLYKSSALDRAKDDNYSPNINVAYATYARAALNRQDYPNAEKYAILAREGYPLMSKEEYNGGFATPNSEWIWSCYGSSEETLYYYSYFSYIAYNSSAGAVKSYPKCISRELYNKIPTTDIRRDLFLDPKTDKYTTSTGAVSTGSTLYKRAFSLHPNLNEAAKIFAYMQFKIGATDMPGVGNLNNFRSSEMYLIEAEADYFQSKPDAAQNALIALTKNSGRDPQYSCTKTGTDLLNEIKTYRAIELWGEGFDWFDMKRWGDSIDRKVYDDGGNFITAVAKKILPTENNKWTWKIPFKESDYNHAINTLPEQK